MSEGINPGTDAPSDYQQSHTLARKCPHLAAFDPTMPDPYPILAQARVEAPVFYIPELDYWCVTRHEDVAKIYRDPISFSSEGMHDMRVPMPAAVVKDVGPNYVFPFKGQLNTTDPPQHTRIRKLMMKAFTPRQVGGREGEIRNIANDLIDSFPDEGVIELVSAYTSLVPTRVIALVLGMDQELAPKFSGWVGAFFALSASPEMAEEEATMHWSRLVEFDRLTRAFVEERRESPADDLTSELIRAESDDGSPSLTDDELLANILGLIAAASDTTSILIANTVYMLLRKPQLWEAISADRTLIPAAVEEALRLRSPVRGNRRTTTRDVELGGVKIPAGVSIYFQLGSANRDEAVFENPEQYDLRRENVGEHLGLGYGPHFCIGASLARLEARVAVETLIRRVPELRLGRGQEDELDYSYNIVVPLLNSLYIERP